MTAPTPERHAGSVDLSANGIRIRAGFGVLSGELLAGGPVELEFFVRNLGSRPLRLGVSGDRLSQRPGQFRFTAMFAGAPLADPAAAVPFIGGPMGLVEVSTDSPWHQPLLLNQFIRFEDTLGRLAPGSADRLDLACEGPLPLAATDAASLVTEGAPIVRVDLAFDLRRDDAALTALAARLLGEIIQGPPAARERSLALLLAMRSAARPQIEALAGHPEVAGAIRVRQVLAALA